ncbi:hypothetical protein HDZ31DRAFT_32289, partial [Schizophyllum fasciatum]
AFLGIDWGRSEELSQPLVLLPESQSKGMNASAKVATLDEQIVAIRARLAGIISYRNLYTPIFSLSDDILAEIFLWVVRESPDFTDRHCVGVCRRWRSIGVSTPALWSYLCYGESLASWPSTLQLSRCKEYPLTTKIVLEPEMVLEDLHSALRRLKDRLDQIRVLEVAADLDYNLRDFVGLYGKNKRENLRNLSLSLGSPGYNGLFVLTTETTQNLVSHLTAIRLTNVVVNWDDLRNLTTMSISYVCDSASKQMCSLGYSSLFALLRRSPALETLLLRDCINATEHATPSETIGLPFLNLCDLRAATVVCIKILSAIKIPPSTSIHVALPETITSVDDILPVMKILHDHFERPSAPALRALRLDLDRPAVWFGGPSLPGCRWYTDCRLDRIGGRGPPAELSVHVQAADEGMLTCIVEVVLQSALSKDVELLDWRQTREWEGCLPGDVFRERLLCLLPALRSVVGRCSKVDSSWLQTMREMAEAASDDSNARPQDRKFPPLRDIYWVESVLREDVSKNVIGKFTGQLRQTIDACARTQFPLANLILDPGWLKMRAASESLDVSFKFALLKLPAELSQDLGEVTDKRLKVKESDDEPELNLCELRLV